MTWNKKKDIFALMCGHGTMTNGKWDCGCVYGKYTEADLMLEITKVAVKYLRKSGVRVITDADSNNNKNMIECVKWANKNYPNCKKYMSIHCDYRLAPSGIAPLFVSSSGKKMATTVGKSIAKSMGMKWRGAFKRNDLYELNATKMTSVILETGAIRLDLSSLKKSEQYGKALAKGICSYLGVKFLEKPSLPKLPERGYFKKGDKGAEVKKLQACLNYLGYDCGEVDGIIGDKTVAAIKKFKKKYDIGTTGRFGAKSLKKAKELL